MQGSAPFENVPGGQILGGRLTLLIQLAITLSIPKEMFLYNWKTEALNSDFSKLPFSESRFLHADEIFNAWYVVLVKRLYSYLSPR